MCDLACSRRFGWIADSIGLHHLSKKKRALDVLCRCVQEWAIDEYSVCGHNSHY